MGGLGLSFPPHTALAMRLYGWESWTLTASSAGGSDLALSTYPLAVGFPNLSNRLT